MNRIVQLVILLCLFLGGCVFVNLPFQEPLTEKTIGGRGANKILVISVSGLITDDDKKGGLGITEKPNMAAQFKEELELAGKDDDIRAIILKINTPGGSVTTCDVMHHELVNFKKSHRHIPVVAELMDTAASGGYYIAVGADKIIAHPTTITGSIGVIAYNINATGLMEKVGIVNQTIKSGDKKDIGSPLKQMSDDERKILQSVIDSMYERFLTVITEGRADLTGMDPVALKKIADGRIYTAEQALKLKLIDKTGYMDDAVEYVKGLAGIKEARLITYAPERSYKNNIYSLAGEQAKINLINIDGSALTGKFGMSFMYLWMP
ncbi:signal peptide peptidase SppA [bacterium]|nr:MAG: signal peptide peptidase SppA [bacterium]